MILSGPCTISAPREKVWQALLDPAILQRSIPGCETLTPTGENRYSAVVKAGVASIKGRFTAEVALNDLKPPESYTLSSRAKAPIGFVEGAGHVELKEDGAATTVTFAGDAKVGGMLASVAGRLIEAAAQKNIRDLFANLEREIAKQK